MGQPVCILTVKSARCSAMSMLLFGSLFMIAASTFFGVNIARMIVTSNKDHDFLSLKYIWKYWLLAYPVLIAIWSLITGAVGMCACSPTRPNSMCKIGTFFAFCLVLLGIEAYLIKDFSPYLITSFKNLKADSCDSSAVWNSCYFNVSLSVIIILLAGLLVLDCLWSVICCCGSLFCSNEVQPSVIQNEDQALQPSAPTFDAMMQESPPMYNSDPPTNPTMQGNAQPLQGNAMPMIQYPPGEPAI